MLANAKREVIIANAYFFPGYRILHAMRNAARRGVSVKLIVLVIPPDEQRLRLAGLAVLFRAMTASPPAASGLFAG